MSGETALQLLPPWSATTIASALAALTGLALAIAWLLGPANLVARRRSLQALHAATLGLLVVILFNPVTVRQLPGPIQRPEVFYLIDTSASMQMGNPQSRWEQVGQFVREAHSQIGSAAAIVKPFRFGQRLSAIEQREELGLPVITPPKAAPAASLDTPSKPFPRLSPGDADTRLQAALRQISSRFGRVPPRGIVVFSDGAVHDEVGLNQVAADFGKLKVPVHVVPVGDTRTGGDVAIAAVVAPTRVRKFTEVEVQVFIRSFGYDGRRGEVRLLGLENDGRRERPLAAVPVTLQSGFQSVSLSFRTDLATRKLRVDVPLLANEVSDKNNRIETAMAIDRTKIRVLYVEGSPQPVGTRRTPQGPQLYGPFSELKTALTEDEDIECVVLSVTGGLGIPVRIGEYQSENGTRGFPATVAELSAFDMILLSNVHADSFSEQQLEWIEEWIKIRGGGLCMVGGERSFASGAWHLSPLARMLPVEMLPGSNDWAGSEAMQLVAELPAVPHPIWNLVSDDKLNRQMVGTMPGVMGLNRWKSVRSNLSTILGTMRSTAPPAVTALSGVLPAGSRTAQITTLPKPAPAARLDTTQKESVTSSLPSGPIDDPSRASAAAIVAGRYGRGRTLAVAFPITSPYADELIQKWGSGDNRYYAKWCRNLVYWLTENSAIGRRRLVASADKRFYRPGESIDLRAVTYDESAAPTRDYRVTALIEPRSIHEGEAESDASPLKWPAQRPRESGETNPHLLWGEEFDLSPGTAEQPASTIQLPIADAISSGTSSQSLRVELTAFEDLTQVDSTSLEIQILHDPYEQQNPLPQHQILKSVAQASGGQVLSSPAELAQILTDVPPSVGTPLVRRSPWWSHWWLWGTLITLLTIEWCWRRYLGLA